MNARTGRSSSIGRRVAASSTASLFAALVACATTVAEPDLANLAAAEDKGDVVRFTGVQPTNCFAESQRNVSTLLLEEIRQLCMKSTAVSISKWRHRPGSGAGTYC